MSAEGMDPQEQGDRIMCAIDALMKLENGTFPLPGFTTKDSEPNYQMGGNRFSRAGMALYEYQKRRGLLESQKKEQSERTVEDPKVDFNSNESQRSQEPGAHSSSLVRPYNRDAHRPFPEMRRAQFRCTLRRRSRWHSDDKITARNTSPCHEPVRDSSSKSSSSAAHEYRREPTTDSSAMLSQQMPQKRSGTATLSGYNPYHSWGSGKVPPLAFDWFGLRTKTTHSPQPPMSSSPDPTSAASYFDQDTARDVFEKGHAEEVSASSNASQSETTSHIQSTPTESASSTSDDGHRQNSSEHLAKEKHSPQAFTSDASSERIRLKDISYHLLQPLPERSDPYTHLRAANDSVGNRSRYTSKFHGNTMRGPPKAYSVASATFKANQYRHPPPKPYDPYLGKPARNASGGRLAASRYFSQQSPAARYTKSTRFADTMPFITRGPTPMWQGPLLTQRSNRFGFAERPRAYPKPAQNANAGLNYRPLAPMTHCEEQSRSLFRARTPPCLRKAPSHAPEEHYALAAIKASEMTREAAEESGDENSDVIITEESENDHGDVDLRVKETTVALGSGTLQTRGSNVSEKVPSTRWETRRSALVQANTNGKRRHEHSEEVYLSSDEKVSSPQPSGWKGTYVRHPPKYAKHALRRKLEAQRPSRMTLIFERQNGLTDEALLEDANLHLKTIRASAHSPDPAVQKIHSEELQALKHALKVLQQRIDDNNTSDGHKRIERLGMQWKEVHQSVKEWFETESRIRMDIEMQHVLRRLADFFGCHPETRFTSDNRYNTQKSNAAGTGFVDRW